MHKYKYINKFPPPLLKDFVNDNVLPIIGAGFSKNVNIPSGKEMLDWNGLGIEIAKDIQDYDYTNPIDAITVYEYDYNRINLIEKLNELLLTSSIKPGNTHQAFCELKFEFVCTTNFDSLLEDCYNSISKKCYPLIGSNDLSLFVPKHGIRLLKLHGDLNNRHNLILTEEDYDNFIENNPLLVNILMSQYITKTLLLIGFSGEDPDFRHLRKIIKKGLGDLIRPAYVIKINSSDREIKKFKRRGVTVIDIKGDPNDQSKILENIFIELKNYLDEKGSKLQSIPINKNNITVSTRNCSQDKTTISFDLILTNTSEVDFYLKCYTVRLLMSKNILINPEIPPNSSWIGQYENPDLAYLTNTGSTICRFMESYFLVTMTVSALIITKNNLIPFSKGTTLKMGRVTLTVPEGFVPGSQSNTLWLVQGATATLCLNNSGIIDSTVHAKPDNNSTTGVQLIQEDPCQIIFN